MVAKRVSYAIYKKTKGYKYPGESWDIPMPLEDAQKKFDECYRNPGHERDQDFRIVKITEEAMPLHKKRK